jgi:hypothetical protein
MHAAAATILALLLGGSAFAGTFTTPPATTNNDDSCDIALQPAATLLLPYFEVDFNSPSVSAVQTLFTVQNVSPLPQIANVTLWTDWGYPALSFPIFLTGYDVQPVSLYDLFTRGTLPGTSSGTIVPTNPTIGSQPGENSANPNFLAGAAAACAGMPFALSPPVVADLQDLFTARRTAAGVCTQPVGGQHANAIGYATIDVVATCAAKNPGSSDYFGILLFDNTLTGDYQLIVPRGDRSYAQGGTLVHIRAIPEGGAAGTFASTNLPYTFYDRYTRNLQARTADRRQALPSAFVPRYIQGGTGGFNSTLKIWRETANAGTCAGADSASRAGDIPLGEVVRFDEHENATVLVSAILGIPPARPSTSATASIPTSSNLFPLPATSGDVAGWIYLNLDNGGSANYSAARGGFRPGVGVIRASQNWVIVSMFAEPTYAIELPAIALGNGCSPARLSTGAPAGNIGPAPNPTP